MSLHWIYVGRFAFNSSEPRYAVLQSPKYYGLTLQVTEPIQIQEVRRFFPDINSSGEVNGLQFREEGYLVFDVFRLTPDDHLLLSRLIRELHLNVVNEIGQLVSGDENGRLS